MLLIRIVNTSISDSKCFSTKEQNIQRKRQDNWTIAILW